MDVAVLGRGAIGRLVATTLAGRADVAAIDRAHPPRGEAPVDIVLVCVKTPGTAWAAGLAARLLAPDGVALTLQNGLGNLEALAAAVGAWRTAAGSVHTGVYLEGDRVVATGPLRLTLAREGAGERVDPVAALLRAGGAEVAVVDAAAPLLWRKAVVNAAVNSVTAILGVANGALAGHAAGALVADALAREAARVATAAGVPIAGADAERLWREAARATAANVSSMLQDVRAGRETEIDAICGAIAREGERFGAPAPLAAAVALLIHALEPPAE